MENKDYIKKVDKGERRFLDLEFRAKEDSRMIEGYAIVFNKDSENLGGFIERIKPEAVEGRLNDDIVALLNHDQNHVLARNGKTMELEVDKNGLKYRFEAPNTTAGNDLLENVRLGNISKSSFAFTVDADEWDFRDNGPDIRTITKIKRLYDVSPVTYPAYPDTTVAQSSRSYAQVDEEEDKQPIYKTKIKRRKLNLKKK